jgi:hypothetical protein
MPSDTTLETFSTLERGNASQPMHPTAPKRPNPCADDKPACPACGGLQCLCRPRFFPGQLLTDEDLNRLQRYVIDKNKLHARYLHGWGVASGLEVVCDPCTTSQVVVRTGYALSPCGDDIVVCKDHAVNVCELIDQCRPQTDVVCDPPYQQNPRECRDGVEKWVLAICYDERPSRGITALTGSTDTACCSSCGCGGSGSCGCNGSSKVSSTTTSTASKTRKTYRPQCEPTQICEGYRFTAYKQPKETKLQLPGSVVAGTGGSGIDLIFAWMYANRARFGPMLERLLCCVIAALELRASFGEGKYTDPRQAVSAYQGYLDALREFAANFSVHRCAFADKLATEAKAAGAQIDRLRSVRALTSADKTLISSGMRRLDYSLFDLIAECFCSALLPAGPEPAADNCVPLAVLTVRSRDCRVVEICNWEARKLLITWRTVGYWLSWLPWPRVRETIAKLCCADTPQRTIIWPLTVLIGMVLNQARTTSPAGGADATESRPTALAGRDSTLHAATAETASSSATREAVGDPLDRALNSDNLLAHLAGGFERLRAGADENAPEWVSLIARFADGSALAPLAGRAAVKKAELGDLGANLGLDALREQVAELQKTLAEYKTTMDGLKNLIAKGRGG